MTTTRTTTTTSMPLSPAILRQRRSALVVQITEIHSRADTMAAAGGKSAAHFVRGSAAALTAELGDVQLMIDARNRAALAAK